MDQASFEAAIREYWTVRDAQEMSENVQVLCSGATAMWYRVPGVPADPASNAGEPS